MHLLAALRNHPFGLKGDVGEVFETPEDISLQNVFSSTTGDDYKNFVLQKSAWSRISVLQEGHHRYRHWKSAKERLCWKRGRLCFQKSLAAYFVKSSLAALPFGKHSLCPRFPPSEDLSPVSRPPQPAPSLCKLRVPGSIIRKGRERKGHEAGVWQGQQQGGKRAEYLGPGVQMSKGLSGPAWKSTHLHPEGRILSRLFWLRNWSYFQQHDSKESLVLPLAAKIAKQ